MLSAGVSERIITPEFPAFLAGYPQPQDRYHEVVHDDLRAHCFYLKNGGQEFAIVTMDLIYYSKRRVKLLRRQIEEASGIPADHIVISCTHTHSSPVTVSVPFRTYDDRREMYPHYLDMVDARVVGGVCEAKYRAFPARIGMDKGHCGKEQGVGGNRRHQDGISDPQVWVIAIQDMDGKLRGAIVNYALHPTFLHAESKAISADYPGYIYEYLKKQNEGAVVGFQIGAAGNQSSRHFRSGQSFEEARRVGYAIGEEAQRVIDGMEFNSDPRLMTRSTEVYPPLKTFPSLERALSDKREAEEGLERSRRNGEPYGVQRTWECTLIGANKMLGIVKAGPDAMEGMLTNSPFEIRVLGIDDGRMVTLPSETFVEYALRLKKESPHQKTYLATCTGGFCSGYICTPEAHAEGGYEALGSIYPGEAGDVLIDAALGLLED